MGSIERVGVIGLGTMGHGIAQVFALGGLTVRAYDDVAAARDSALDRIQTNLKAAERAKLVTRSETENALARITITESDSDAVADAQFVTEAVREDLAVKQELFPRLEVAVDDDTILVSNTSTFPMTQIATGMRRPERALNTHWFNPPHIVPLVEVVPGEKTTTAAVDVTVELLERCGKLAVRLRQELPGFLINRIQTAMMREVVDLMERGVASPEDIDRAMRGSVGLRLAALGPLRVWDYAGLDICGRVFSELVQDIRSSRELHESVRARMNAGDYGVKTGRGFFDHPAESRGAAQATRDERYLALVKLFHTRGPAPGEPS